MRHSLIALSAAGLASAAIIPKTLNPFTGRAVALAQRQEANPFTGKELTPNPTYAEKLEAVYEHFEQAGDAANAAKTRQVQEQGTFFWISQVASLPDIDEAIATARARQAETGQEQIVGLVLYDLPDRDCSGGESSGEFESDKDGLARYKAEYVDEFAAKVAEGSELTFAIVLEPDAIGNIVTNQGNPFCAQATPVYEEGIAYAISKLQSPNVHLYLDASHGGWLGWDANLEPAAQEFAKIVEAAGNNGTAKVRGFSTNVSNYNPFKAEEREPYTEGSNSYDEGSYATSLAPHLEAAGLPAHFIIDQGRVAAFGAREEWGEWCNVAPAGYGQAPGSATDNPYVDALVWVKPGGESDGECGYEGAPPAGEWFTEYAALLVENASF